MYLFCYLSLLLVIMCNPILSKKYFEVAIVVDEKPTRDFDSYLLNRARVFSNTLAQSNITVKFWGPIWAKGCPHFSRSPKFRTVHYDTPFPYWRGCTLAHTTIWNDFCIYRENVLPNDTLVVFESDILCVVNNCASAIDVSVQMQSSDIFYLGWCLFKSFNKGGVYREVPPLCLHAYSITCAAVLKTRNLWDPCGSALDLQVTKFALEGLVTWDMAIHQLKAFGINKTSEEEISADPHLEYQYEGMFRQIKNITILQEQIRNSTRPT